MKRLLVLLLATVLGGSMVALDLAKTKPQGAAERSFTYANVVSFFKAAHFRVTEVQKRCTVFFEGEFTSANVYNYCVIMVENDDEDIQVTFYLTDAHEMNWITEFIDSPFFNGAEKQKLFGLLNRERAARGEKIGRFKVDLNRWHPRHAEIIVFSFTPIRGG